MPRGVRLTLPSQDTRAQRHTHSRAAAEITKENASADINCSDDCYSSVVTQKPTTTQQTRTSIHTSTGLLATSQPNHTKPSLQVTEPHIPQRQTLLLWQHTTISNDTFALTPPPVQNNTKVTPW
eukprot:scaffold3240_cov197-Alexandrium_tamarense.AAC.14